MRSGHGRGRGARERVQSARRGLPERRGDACVSREGAATPARSTLLADDLDEADVDQRNAERHAFLLTLGVWEVIPVEAFESREMQNRERVPWTGARHDARMHRIAEAGGWRFVRLPVVGRRTWQRLDRRGLSLSLVARWELPRAMQRGQRSCSPSARGSTPRLDHVAAFCPGCTSDGVAHQKRYQSSPDEDYPSILAIELQTDPWIPAVLNGETLQTPQGASSVWWAERPPSRAGLQQSPLRYLPLCDSGIGLTAGLRQLARITTLEAADQSRLEDLLGGVAPRFRGWSASRLTRLIERSSPSVHWTAPPRVRATGRTRSRRPRGCGGPDARRRAVRLGRPSRLFEPEGRTARRRSIRGIPALLHRRGPLRDFAEGSKSDRRASRHTSIQSFR